MLSATEEMMMLMSSGVRSQVQRSGGGWNLGRETYCAQGDVVVIPEDAPDRIPPVDDLRKICPKQGRSCYDQAGMAANGSVNILDSMRQNTGPVDRFRICKVIEPHASVESQIDWVGKCENVIATV